jgi:hypothetical protein
MTRRTRARKSSRAVTLSIGDRVKIEHAILEASPGGRALLRRLVTGRESVVAREILRVYGEAALPRDAKEEERALIEWLVAQPRYADYFAEGQRSREQMPETRAALAKARAQKKKRTTLKGDLIRKLLAKLRASGHQESGLAKKVLKGWPRNVAEPTVQTINRIRRETCAA